MRIPLWLATLLALATVSLTWWLGTRHYDFLGPASAPNPIAGNPADQETELVAHPPADPPQAPIEPTGPPEPSPAAPLPLPILVYDDPRLPPALDAYLLVPPLSGAELAARAIAMEQQGRLERALLAWERILDSGPADLSWRAPARAAVRRLRDQLPPWNTDPAHATPLIIQIGADIRFGQALESAAARAAAQISDSSSGVLRVEAIVTLGEAAGPETEALPVAVWITDAADPPLSSTKVLSFTSPPAPAELLADRILATIYDLARGRLEDEIGFPPFPILDGDGDPLDALETALTRHAWNQFGKSLQSTAPDPESPGP